MGINVILSNQKQTLKEFGAIVSITTLSRGERGNGQLLGSFLLARIINLMVRLAKV
jgi:hypothetical protein